MNALLEWLSALPEAALLPAIAIAAALENIFPPFPADVVVALGGILAARAGVSPWPAFLAVWLGNVAGAAVMYALGRRFGAEWIERKFHLATGGAADRRFEGWYKRAGVAGLFLSRFIPGVRAIVPPVAGAMKLPLFSTILAVASASALWYGGITWLAFRAGANWERVMGTVTRSGRWAALGAGVLIVAGAAVWLVRRRRA
jgi:membrane protein DedA with SNARE-associated domain